MTKRVKAPVSAGSAEKDIIDDVNSLSGLILFGTITDRVKKSVTVSGVDREVVTYTVESTDIHTHYVDDFAPDSYYELGDKVAIPVYVKPYTKKTGVPAYMLKTQKDSVTPIHGERF